jgi:hypothetical protein
MQIIINQAKVSLHQKYKVSIGSEEKYIATKKLFRLLSEIELKYTQSDSVRLTIKRQWEWFKYSYDISESPYSVYEFRTISFWKNHYQCLVGADKYEIFGHKGRKHSVYLNDKMIGYWELGAVTWFEGDVYKIHVNKHVNVELIVAFCILLDDAKQDNKRGTLSLNLGWFGPQAREFDTTWVE